LRCPLFFIYPVSIFSWHRAQHIARLVQLLAVERNEAALVRQAQSQSLPVEHRADISPLALLRLWLITAARVTNGHTSPDHAYDLVQPGRR
jgi:hypothetical protein